VLNVGDTVMTRAQLLKCIEDPKSALDLLGAFVECLKWDDDKNGNNKKNHYPTTKSGKFCARNIALVVS
jgi:hypothetical protein